MTMSKWRRAASLHRASKAGRSSLPLAPLIPSMLYTFDLLERSLPLGDRKAKLAKLAKLLARAPVGIVFNEHTDEDGAVVFRHACKMGLEGIVSKRLTAPYRSGQSRDWLKVKNPDVPRCGGRVRGQ
jgi:ATP-dependent DNA ligase